ncbi:MAG: hypothetical protein GF308_00995 [Candidatus Heimdallarchaeota archaeon]|nr:hypothetical protein [Candidatus Heimdallarchaeota archaeon]
MQFVTYFEAYLLDLTKQETKILENLSTDSHFRRKRAVKKAASFTNEQIIEKLFLILLLDEKSGIRKAVISTLGKISKKTKEYNEKIIAAVEKVLQNDPNQSVKQEARKVLARIKTK